MSQKVNDNVCLGRSGCSFKIDSLGVITKISKNEDYNKRLLYQYNKQKAFDNKYFSTPHIYKYNQEKPLHEFSMEYVHGLTFDKFCIEASAPDIMHLCNSIVGFIETNLKTAHLTSISTPLLEDKIRSITDKDCRYRKYLLENPINKLPIGYCHGDFTISNILLADRFYLIDFLDNLFDSPVYDLVKIRQDTYHKLYFTIGEFNNKAKICLDYLDNLILTTFGEYINSHEYTYLSILNLLRIIPYLEDQSEINVVKKELEKYETYIASSW